MPPQSSALVYTSLPLAWLLHSLKVLGDRVTETPTLDLLFSKGGEGMGLSGFGGQPVQAQFTAFPGSLNGKHSTVSREILPGMLTFTDWCR